MKQKTRFALIGIVVILGNFILDYALIHQKNLSPQWAYGIGVVFMLACLPLGVWIGRKWAENDPTPDLKRLLKGQVVSVVVAQVYLLCCEVGAVIYGTSKVQVAAFSFLCGAGMALGFVLIFTNLRWQRKLAEPPVRPLGQRLQDIMAGVKDLP